MVLTAAFAAGWRLYVSTREHGKICHLRQGQDRNRIKLDRCRIKLDRYRSKLGSGSVWPSVCNIFAGHGGLLGVRRAVVMAERYDRPLMRKRFGPSGIVGAVLFVAALVRPILAAWGQARLVDQFVTPRIAPYVTNVNLLYIGLVGFVLILFELRRISSANPPPPIEAEIVLNDDDIRALRVLGTGEGIHAAEEIVAHTSLTEERVLFHLDRLKATGNAELGWYGYYSITPKGRAILVARGYL